MKSDQIRVSKLLTDTVTLLCKNGLVYGQEIKVQGLLGITVDKNEVFLVDINEVIGSNVRVPCSQHPLTAASASSEPTRRKSAIASGAAKVVDLTRVADPPRAAVHQPHASQQPAGQIAAGRKHRQAVRSVPAPRMIPQHQQVPARMQHSFHPRMTSSPLQNTAASQLASNYVTQLQQQVARGMSPMSRPCTTADDDDDDEEDVVIVGTGHEEPSPSWSSPMRKRPLPSRVPSSPALLPKKRPSYQPPEKKSAVRDSPVVIEQLGSGDAAGSLELTSDDVPSSVEDMIMKLAPAAMTTPKKQSCNTAVPPGVFTTDTTASGNVEGSSDTAVPVLSSENVAVADFAQPNRAVVDTTSGDDVSKAAATSQEASVENTRENTAHSAHPFVYTDIAYDMHEGDRADAPVSTEAAGCDVVTSAASQVDEKSEWNCRTWWHCQSRGCFAVCTEESELADHYRVAHSSSLDLVIPPTVIEPTDSQPDSNVESQSSASNDAEGISSMPASAASVPQSSSSAVVSGSFVCPFDSCGISCSSRDDLVAHAHLSHEAANVVQPVCKEEKDDSASASK